jgi:hypothetical protein
MESLESPGAERSGGSRSGGGSAAPVKTDDTLRGAIGVGMDYSHTGEIVALTELQSRQSVPKRSRILQIGRPFVHVLEEQACFQIFQDRLHDTRGDLSSPQIVL